MAQETSTVKSSTGAKLPGKLNLSGKMQNAPQGKTLGRIGQYVRRWKLWLLSVCEKRL